MFSRNFGYFEKKEFSEASVTDHFQRDLFQTVEQQMMDINELNVSERTFRLLEHEKE